MRWLRAGFLPVSVMTLVSAAFIVPLPLYLERPGRVVSLAACVELAEPAVDAVEGDYLLTTISVQPGTVVDTVVAGLEPDTAVVARQQIVPPGVDTRTYFRDQRRLFRTTADIAAAVAMSAAGLPANIGGDGARVLQVFPDTPAEAVLEPGDVITAVNGSVVTTDAELRDAIRAVPAGRPLQLEIERKGETITVEVVAAVIDGTPVIGVAPETVNPKVMLPVDVTVRSGNVGGPSAGLMIALTVYDKVRDDVDLAGGRVVSGSGTLDHEGRIGRVGGVGMKVIASHREGADVFLAPAGDFEAAQRALPAGSAMRVVRVATFDDALQALTESAAEAAPRPDEGDGDCPFAEAA